MNPRSETAPRDSAQMLYHLRQHATDISYAKQDVGKNLMNASSKER